MTAVETTVAGQIKRKNPTVDTDPVSGKARVPFATIARRCVKSLGRARITGLNASDCGSLPIFVTGYDAVGPAETMIKQSRGHRVGSCHTDG